MIVSLEPASGARLWSGPVSDIDACIAAARAAWPRWALTPLTDRMELARRTGREMRRVAPDLADLLARETGVPLWEAHGEVEAAIARVDVFLRAQGERCAQRRHDNGIAGVTATRHKPHGVLAVISPCAQPLLAPFCQILPALVAGNVVVFKPSEKAPAIGEALTNCLLRGGMPQGAIQMVTGGPEHGRALALHEAIDGLLFAGSSPVGLALARKYAQRPDRMLRLDMGGNNPIVVWDTLLIEQAAMLIVQSAFAGAGQRNTAARRLIIHDTLAEPMLAAVKKLTDRIICGGPFDDPAPYMGPVCDLASADGLTESFIWLMSNGGHPIRHMSRGDTDLPFVTPGIIDVTDMTERPDVELFGPLLQVIRVGDFDEAIALANDTQFGLCAALVGGNEQLYGQFWTQIRAGLIHWNKPTTIDLATTPMGGLGLSGNLRAGGTYAADSCAIPIASAETELPRAALGVGFHAGD
ncbi:MAG: aldehyde dehydrogenase family protein [Sphingomonadales bacterium]|nr:aldehyde dehydrogenase family protein [Sphingomonadales bacterium]MDE2169217.1 aldehyde dehydrogenase family protein [Sphingomonadales bacterium]